MNTKKIIASILCSILTIISIPVYVVAEDNLIVEEIPMITTDYVQNEIILTTSGDLIDSDSSFFTASVDDYTMINFDAHEINSAEQLETYTSANEEKTYVLNIGGDIEEKCTELENIPGVISAEPNLLFRTMDFTLPSEISSSSLYTAHQKWYFDIMNIPSAWEEFETAGEGVTIAIIDNGYNIDATEFSTNLWTDKDGNHGWNTYTDTADISPIYKSDGTQFDNSFHGTHVAGVIGAINNGKNIIGAAYDAQLMLINAAHYISDDDIPQFSESDLIEAIDYARENGADIINLSLGAYGTAPSLESAVERAYEEGIAIIAAAGNNGLSTDTGYICVPASYDNVIGVMASDKTDTSQLASFSNYDPSGEYYDIAAPGYQILSCTIESGKVAYANGTSQASPLVSSLAALYLSEYPNTTVDELYDAIRNSPTTFYKSNSDVVTDTVYKFKRLDALQLLEYGKVEPELVISSPNLINDSANGYIYGLDEGFDDIADYLYIAEGTGYFEFIPTENGNGTGSVLNIYSIYDELIESHIIIIFGDLNGDSYADGQDAVLSNCAISFPAIYSDAQIYAADVDFDSYITDTDSSIISGHAIKTDYVFQY